MRVVTFDRRSIGTEDSELENCHHRNRRGGRTDRLVSAGLAGQKRRAVLLRAVERTRYSYFTDSAAAVPICSRSRRICGWSGFDNVSYFEYPRWQTLDDSAAQLGRIAEEKSGGNGVHLIGHSLGGTVARRYAASAPKSAVRSLITLGSPYSYGQWSPTRGRDFRRRRPDRACADRTAGEYAPRSRRIVTLHDVGHLALIFHPEALRIIGTELRANRAPESRAAA